MTLLNNFNRKITGTFYDFKFNSTCLYRIYRYKLFFLVIKSARKAELVKRGCVIGNTEIDKRGDSPVFEIDG